MTSLIERTRNSGAAWISKHLKRLAQRLDKVSGAGWAAPQMSYSHGSNIDSPIWDQFKNPGYQLHANNTANLPENGCGVKVHK